MNEIEALAEKWGIQAGYHDVFGKWHSVQPNTVQRLVAALSGGGGSSQAPAEVAASDVNRSPERAFQGDGKRVWGIATQLYSLRSRVNWGHGDFGDLARLIAIAAADGAAAIGLNPMHALFPDRAEQSSPYSPSSRLFLNVLYIDVPAIPEFPGLEKAGLTKDVAALRAPELIDYRSAGKAKLKGLRAAYAGFHAKATPARRADFEAYRTEQGEALLRYACFEVLRQMHAPLPWPQWPEAWRAPLSAALRRFRGEHLAECEFQEFMQWVASRQLQACKDESHRAGMSIGLYTDLAVGIDPNGADAWSRQDAILAGFSIGAPPDEFNPGGQGLGLAPFNPRTFAANDFEPMRALMRALMSHAGAVRMDHVLGLNRLYLIPHGSGAADGAYVHYTFEAVLRVIAEESNRSKCIVVGEDLGTVPDGFRDKMARWGLWTYRVMMFERAQDGRFHPPEMYPAEALATFNTHDLSTFKGWMTSDDLRTKHGLGIDPGETEEQRVQSREKLRWILAERAPGYAADDLAAVAAVLAQTPSRLVTVGLDDVMGVVEQINIPGTTDQHPNWRRKLPVDVEDLGASESLKRVAQAFAKHGRGK